MNAGGTPVADVVFDAPVDQPFSYRVPSDLTVRAGQRVAAPLGGAERVGLVVAVRADAAVNTRLRPLTRVVDAAPLLSPRALELVRFLAAQSLTSLGSTALALLPPPGPGVMPDAASAAGEAVAPADSGASNAERVPTASRARPAASACHAAARSASVTPESRRATGASFSRRCAQRPAFSTSLVITSDAR